MPHRMSAQPAESPVAPLAPDAPTTALPGVGAGTAARLAAQGLHTLFDLVSLFPRRCRALRELRVPEEAAVGDLVRLPGEVHAVRRAWLPGRRSLVTVVFVGADGTKYEARFHNQPWLAKAYTVGQARLVEGELQLQKARFVVAQARVLAPTAAAVGAVQLRYPELDGVSGERLQKWIAYCLDGLDWGAVRLPPLPATLAEHDFDARSLHEAMHRPADAAAHERARRHFAVREAVDLFAQVERARRNRQRRPARAFPVDAALAGRILKRIPFVLSDDQRAAVEAIWRGLAGPAALGVLLQGDVGTGKTAVAVAAALAVLARGGQVAFLAPTETLAEQHRDTVARWLADTGVDVLLLTASQRQKSGAELERALASGRPQLVFGTHALITTDTVLPRLSLVIVDEQHRFGVGQRMALVHKGDNPHVLVMTATPIPRTLALTMFGDLDAVLLRSKPAGHRATPARHVAGERWARVVRSIARAVRRGGRVFVVCPAVGIDGEKGGVVRMHETLSKAFRCGLVHGKLKADERRAALAEFREGKTDVLVGTTVLEVGVDVPEATLIVVAAAERFGIATLHQLRGRVGRGRRRGLAILCGPRTDRVAAVCGTQDGFALAEADLALRGGGELLGTAQSGFADLRALDPIDDLELLLRVRRAVAEPTVVVAEAEA
ncbi:MAG: ATP-dependent helicase RecG [Planctomycetota bacterium]|jgi:ATP-dependent DNA helicase RecG